jgi:alpha-1,3-rhamnosyl/mannosyltransferase
VTIHDVQYLAHPEYFSRVKRRFLGLQVPRVARRADVIAVPTNSVAAMIIEEFGVEAERVVVVPHGFPPPPGFPGRVEAGGPYLLYPAVMWPHKNHALLLEALALAEQPDLRLVFTGAGGPCASAVTERVESLGLTDRVEVLGRVSDDRLEALYRGAAGLVFPSRFEGFGAPLVEAMARGCPVIASTADAVREVVGDAGLLVDPDDVTGWARAMAAVLDGGVRGDLTSAGFRRAEDFSVARAVDAQVSAWRRAHVVTGRVD